MRRQRPHADVTRRRRRRRRLPVAATVALILVAAPVPAFGQTAPPTPAPTVPVVSVTPFDNSAVVVVGDHFPPSADVALAAELSFEDGAVYSGGGTVHTSPAGRFIVGFLLPDRPGASRITVTTSAAGIADQTSSTALGQASASPSATPSEIPPVPSPSPAGSGVTGGGVTTCPPGDEVDGAPGGTRFEGHSYNGHGQTLPAGNYTIGSNTCIENYVFDDSNLMLAGSSSNVTIVNNVFRNWPGPYALGNITGTDITISYNTVKATKGSASAALFGEGSMTNVVISHNDIQDLGAAVDGMQLRFTRVGTNVEIAYNRITDNGRFPIELQQVAHGLRVHDNYATVVQRRTDMRPQLSIAVGNDKDGGGYYDTDTHGVEIYNNIVINKDRGVTQACIESRGNGNVLRNNYCRNFEYVTNYAMTNNSVPTPWYVTDNIVIGPGRGGVSVAQPYNRVGYQPVAPTESGNQRFTMSNAPAVPSWNHAVGVQEENISSP